MKNYRKLILGLVYLICVTAIAVLEIIKHAQADLTGMALLAGGLSTGVAAIVYGNVKEHEHSNGSTSPS